MVMASAKLVALHRAEIGFRDSRLAPQPKVCVAGTSNNIILLGFERPTDPKSKYY